MWIQVNPAPRAKARGFGESPFGDSPSSPHSSAGLPWGGVKVHANARTNRLVVKGAQRFEAWVLAKPVQGQANASVARLLAEHLGVSVTRLRVARGHHRPAKVFQLVGMPTLRLAPRPLTVGSLRLPPHGRRGRGHGQSLRGSTG